MSKNIVWTVVLAVVVAVIPFVGCGSQTAQSPQVADQAPPPPGNEAPASEQAAAPVPPPSGAPAPAPRSSHGSTRASGVPEERNAAQVPAPPATVTLTIPAGTQMALGFGAELTSETAVVGDKVVATLKQPLLAGDRVVFPEGSQVHGTISDVKSAKKGFKDTGGALSIQFNAITAPDGRGAAIAAGFTKVAEGSGAKKGAIIGGSAVGGALLGKMLGKNVGGGAAVGAAIGTAVAGTTKGREAVIKPEDPIQVALEKSASVTVNR